MPDYYRWMPGYQTDPVTRLEMENIWRANDVRYTQIDWDEFYRQNRNSKDGSATYLMEDRVERIANMQLLAEGITRISERLTVRYGIRAARTDSRFYKQMRDLMGRSYFVDRDYYLIDDGVYGNKLQNDLRHPDRIIREGDRFGYDYDLRRNEIGAGGSLEYRADRLRAFIAAEVGAASVFRRGHYEKELFAGNKSFGKSRALHFAPYLFRASAGYSFSVRHHLEMTVYASSRTPDGDDLFLNLEYNNRPVEDPTEEKRYGAELNYTWSGRNVRFRATLFVVRTADGMQVRHYYDDFYATYSDMAAAGIGTLRYGAEATALIRLAYRWNLTLAASAGRYRYADNPVVTVYADANNEVLDRNAASYMGDCSVGNTPQLTGFAGLNYYGPKGWGVQAEAAWTGNRFVEPSLVRRTSRIARQLAESPEAFELFTRQERLGDAFTLNVTLFQIVLFQRLASDSDALGAQPSQRQRPTLQRLRISPCTPHPDRRHVCLPTAGHPLSVRISPDLLRLHILQILISIRFFGNNLVIRRIFHKLSRKFKTTRLMIIGIPKEIKTTKTGFRSPPSGAKELTKRGHKVYVQATAGANSGFPDKDYVAAGAELLPTIEEVYAKAEMIIKVKEPIEPEYKLIRQGQLVFTYFHFASSEPLTRAMVESGAICCAYETVEASDRSLPLLIPMSEVAGRMATQEGCYFLEKPHGGKGKLLGGMPGVKPAKVS